MPTPILVLVAEDEELLRLIVVEVLRDSGFEVMEAEHAEAALNTLQTHAFRTNVLFTDIQMPGTMDGLALAHHTARIWPHVALLITSGRPLPQRKALPDKSRIPREAIPTRPRHTPYSRNYSDSRLLISDAKLLIRVRAAARVPSLKRHTAEGFLVTATTVSHSYAETAVLAAPVEKALDHRSAEPAAAGARMVRASPAGAFRPIGRAQIVHDLRPISPPLMVKSATGTTATASSATTSTTGVGTASSSARRG